VPAADEHDIGGPHNAIGLPTDILSQQVLLVTFDERYYTIPG